MPRWIQTLLIFILALAAGLFYGWKIAPVEYVDLAPNALHAKYRAEYILMVAEAYQKEGDLDLAAHRLAFFGSTHPAKIISESLDSANYTENETEMLKTLLGEIEAWQPSFDESKP